MKQVFISYSSKDFAQAQAVRNVLEQNGISCWMAPADIPGGSNYTKEIPIAIRGCQAFVLMLSNNAQNSHWVLKELDSAVNEGKIILPFQLEDVPLSDEFNFLLTGAQRYDAYQRKAEALNRLVARIKAIIGTTAPEQPQPQPEPEPEPVKKKIEFPTFQMPKKEEQKQAFSSAACPACGSLDVTEFPNKVKPREPVEHIVNIAGRIVSGALGLFVSMVVSALLLDFCFFELDMDGNLYDFLYMLLPLVVIAATIVCVIYGGRLVATWIKRQRIRKHIKVTECRCNTCQKKFQAVNNEY